MIFGDGHNPPALGWATTIFEARGGKLAARCLSLRFETRMRPAPRGRTP